jgi:hypothetical protein
MNTQKTKDPILERICQALTGHKYKAQSLRFSAILNKYGKVYEICDYCGHHHFLGWKHSLDDKEYASLEDDGIQWQEVHW